MSLPARAGGSVELHAWMGGIHAFETWAPETSMARACMLTRTSYLERALYALANRES